MAVGGSSKVYRRRGKRSRNGVVEEDTSRLSNLPDNVLHHILSFLESKPLVRTSLLSRRWRCLWKEVPVVNVQTNLFRSNSDFKEHFDKFLSLRSPNAAICSVNYYHWYFSSWSRGETPSLDVFHKVMEHAATGHLSHLKFRGHEYYRASFDDMAASIIAYRHHESLTALDLEGVSLEWPMTSQFRLVTDLRLSHCDLHLDILADFPCLNNLRLFDFHSRSSKISGLELVRLELQEVYCERTIEVLAPKLKSFFFQSNTARWNSFPKLDLPALDRAYIRIQWTTPFEKENDCIFAEKASRASIALLCRLHNVEHLKLCFDYDYAYETIGTQFDHPLTDLKSLVKPEASPFTRLKALKVEYLDGTRTVIPYQVIGFFFNGSPHSEDKTFELEKVELPRTNILYYDVWK